MSPTVTLVFWVHFLDHNIGIRKPSRTQQISKLSRQRMEWEELEAGDICSQSAREERAIQRKSITNLQRGPHASVVGY